MDSEALNHLVNITQNYCRCHTYLTFLGVLFARARSDIRFGLINQLPKQDITHFKVEMQCPGLHKSVVVRKNIFYSKFKIYLPCIADISSASFKLELQETQMQCQEGGRDVNNACYTGFVKNEFNLNNLRHASNIGNMTEHQWLYEMEHFFSSCGR